MKKQKREIRHQPVPVDSPKCIDIWSLPETEDITEEFNVTLEEIKTTYDITTDEIKKVRN